MLLIYFQKMLEQNKLVVIHTTVKYKITQHDSQILPVKLKDIMSMEFKSNFTLGYILATFSYILIKFIVMKKTVSRLFYTVTSLSSVNSA